MSDKTLTKAQLERHLTDMKEDLRSQYEKTECLEEKLIAAEELIEAQKFMIECFNLHRPRVKAIDMVAKALDRWEEVCES